MSGSLTILAVEEEDEELFSSEGLSLPSFEGVAESFSVWLFTTAEEEAVDDEDDEEEGGFSTPGEGGTSWFTCSSIGFTSWCSAEDFAEGDFPSEIGFSFLLEDSSFFEDFDL